MAAPHLEIELAPFALGSRHFEAAIQVYASLFVREWEPSAALFSDQASRRDFHGRVALVDGRVIGMGFGARAEAGHSWYDSIAQFLLAVLAYRLEQPVACRSF